MISEFLDLMADTVVIQPFLGMSTDGYAQPRYGAATTYRARIEQGPKRIIGFDGQEVVSAVKVIVGSTAAITVKDLLTLPDDFSPRSPAILRVESVRDGSAPHHAVLYA